MAVKISADIIAFKIVACFVISLVNILGVFLPIFYTDWFFRHNGIKKYNCLLAGILFSSAISQMLAESEKTRYLDQDGPDSGFPVVHLFFGIGFGLTMACQFVIEGVKRQNHNKRALELLLERTNSILSDTNPIDVETNEDIGPFIQKNQPSLFAMFFIFAFENMLTGIAIGIQRNSGGVIVLVVSSAATDWIESVLFCMGIAYAYGTQPNYKSVAFKYATAYSIMASGTTIFWVVLMSSIGETESINDISGIIMSLLAGSFIYMSVKDLLAKSIDEVEITGNYPPIKDVVSYVGQFFLGFAFVNLVVFIENRVY